VTKTAPVDTELPGPAALAIRPQPLGAFPLPLGYLLIPADTATEAARSALLTGRLPDEWPAALRAHELTICGGREAALAALDGADPISRYNRFVLDPDSGHPDRLRDELGEFGVLVDLVLFVIGRCDMPPQPDGLDAELLAVVLSAHASHALNEGDPLGAIDLLERAAAAATDSGCLPGVLLGAAASICRDVADPAAQQRLERAVRLLDGADGLGISRAELHLNLAGLLHEQADDRPELLNQAIPHYHSALRLAHREEAPLLWAATHANLASAYLTMSATADSGGPHLARAAQSLRSALEVYTRAAYPEQWASVQLNLANSLVYTAADDQADHLVEAVELYEALLDHHDRDSDPVGRAAILAHQGNALDHLGRFDEAKVALDEARSLFEKMGDDDSVHAVSGVLDEITRHQNA
jgi:tetratricopeptide (TPR) repeat protein